MTSIDGIVQLTDTDIQDILCRNKLKITFNDTVGKYELHQIYGARKLKLASSQFKTPLIASAKTIDKGRQQK